MPRPGHPSRRPAGRRAAAEQHHRPPPAVRPAPPPEPVAAADSRPTPTPQRGAAGRAGCSIAVARHCRRLSGLSPLPRLMTPPPPSPPVAHSLFSEAEQWNPGRRLRAGWDVCGISNWNAECSLSIETSGYFFVSSTVIRMLVLDVHHPGALSWMSRTRCCARILKIHEIFVNFVR